jgi:hypothetical protein
MSQSAYICDLVVEILQEHGIPVLEDPIPTYLIKGGCFIGHKFRFCGGYALWYVGGNTIEFYHEDGELFKMAAIKRQGAA